MPLETNVLGVPLDSVEFKFGQISVKFQPIESQGSWDWWITWESLQVGPVYCGLYMPFPIESHARYLMEYWLKYHKFPAIREYWERGGACR
jgi:hypothetical protein